MRIERTTYKEARLEFFIKQRELAEKRYKRAVKKTNPSDSYLSNEFYLASEAGQELSFYNDVVEMLGRDLSEHKRVKDLVWVCDNKANWCPLKETAGDAE